MIIIVIGDLPNLALSKPCPIYKVPLIISIVTFSFCTLEISLFDAKPPFTFPRGTLHGSLSTCLSQYLLEISLLFEYTQHHYFFLSSTDYCYGLLLLTTFPNQSVSNCSNIQIATRIFYMYFNVTIHRRKCLLHNSEV